MLLGDKNQRAYRLGEIGTALMRQLPAEVAHNITMKFLQLGGLNLLPRPDFIPEFAGLTMTIPSIGKVPHPIGMAAGMDKDCQAPHGFASMGFSFLEVGTVTPRPQSGNPKPRLFRVPTQMALVNRMGFNNLGGRKIADRLLCQHWDHDKVPLGVNLGKNKATDEQHAIADYLMGIELFAPLAKYLVINISSPNTPGLRNLAQEGFLRELAAGARPALERTWIKLDPDMPKAKLQQLVAIIADCGFRGVILTNTHRVDYPERGGLSGHSLMALSNACLEWAYEVHRGSLPMIASGGILSGADILQKVLRGAVGVEIFTAMVYRGPWVVFALLLELSEELKLRGISRLEDALYGHYNGFVS